MWCLETNAVKKQNNNFIEKKNEYKYYVLPTKNKNFLKMSHTTNKTDKYQTRGGTGLI